MSEYKELNWHANFKAPVVCTSTNYIGYVNYKNNYTRSHNVVCQLGS